MRVVIVDRIDSNSKKNKNLLETNIPDIEEIILVNNEIDALSYARLDYDLFIVNTAIDGVDIDFLNYCNQKEIKIIVFTDIQDQSPIDEYSHLKIIDYIIKNKYINSNILLETVKKYIRNSDIKILFFSNDMQIKTELKNHIISQNIEIIEANNPDEIITILNNEEIEMMVVDYDILSQDGLDMIAKIRLDYSMDELPIILFAYFLRNHIIAEFLRTGINNIIYKPYLKEELINLFNLTLDKKELTKDSYEWFLRDTITGLYRYQVIEEFGEKMLRNAKRENKPFSIILIKIIFEFRDNSKIKKNTVLKHFGNILGSSLRRGDLIAKYGLDKAVIILQNTDEKKANLVKNKIKKHIEIFPALNEDGQIVPYSIHPMIEEVSDTNLNTVVDKLDELIYRENMFSN